MEVRLAPLLREFLSDIRTALYRMGQRIDKLPFFYMPPVGPCYERDTKGNWAPNIRTLACMADMQRLESDFPTATDFDWEMFRIGWEAGAKWCAGTQSATLAQSEPDHAGNTCSSPDAAIIDTQAEA